MKTLILIISLCVLGCTTEQVTTGLFAAEKGVELYNKVKTPKVTPDK